MRDIKTIRAEWKLLKIEEEEILAFLDNQQEIVNDLLAEVVELEDPKQVNACLKRRGGLCRQVQYYRTRLEAVRALQVALGVELLQHCEAPTVCISVENIRTEVSQYR